MANPVPTLPNVRIRPMEPKDFYFVQALASELPHFTVPPDYILWFFSHFHPDYCRVLEQDSGELKAYLIAMPTSHPPSGIAIWQVAAAGSIQAFALEYFAAHLRDIADQAAAKSVFFTATDDSISLRMIRSLASRFGNCVMDKLDSVPVGQGEYEFRLLIDKSPKS